MNDLETAVAPPDSLENPVMAPNAFLVHPANEAVLTGQKDKPTPTMAMDVTPFVFFGFLLFSVFVLVALGIRVAGQPNAIEIGVTAAGIAGGLWLLIKPRLPAKVVKSQLLQGQVLESELIRIETSDGFMESVGVRYEFTTPAGRRLEGRAETLIQPEGRRTPPPLGTPIYIWYESNGGFHIL